MNKIKKKLKLKMDKYIFREVAEICKLVSTKFCTTLILSPKLMIWEISIEQFKYVLFK